MRERILEILRGKMPEPVSGEVLSQELAVSRTAVWKHIQALKNEGYTIESVPKKGYILKEVPDRLKPAEVVANLKTKWLGHHIHYCELTTSTNELAKRLAGEGCEDGLVVIAEEQNSGKGRLSRGWFSPFARGVWFSVVLKPPFMPQEASKCTLLAAIAVVKAVNKYQGVQASIKWPNDVLLEGKKLVGILTEMSAEFGKINYIVIGTGINVNVPEEMVPEELRATAVSLADVAREPVSRVELLTDVLGYMEELYEKVLQDGFKPVLEEWKRYSATLGQQVKVIAPDETYIGEAVDIDEDGLLMVKRADGRIEKVIAGDVSIRPARARQGEYEDQGNAAGRDFCDDDDHQRLYHSSDWAGSHYDAAFGRVVGRYAAGQPPERGQYVCVDAARLCGTAGIQSGAGRRRNAGRSDRRFYRCVYRHGVAGRVSY